MKALELQGLEVAYGAVRALKGVSLEVYPGEVVTLLGANGAGKSTTLRAISGLVRPRAGSISFMGEPLTRLSPVQIVRRGIAHCPEGRRVFAGLSVHENLLLGASGRRDRGIGEDIQRMFGLFPILLERRNQAAGTLSGGEQQMLALARALMSRPKLLLLDEPSLGLAPLVVRSIFGTLKALKAAGTTILLVEQNVNLALELADRAYVLRTGQVALEGQAKELQGDERVARAYLGGAA
ncbi:ABC transporter ATP-binding protein [Meiothermus granaticius]|uniref:High-affinity branched-chain amino acid transport ATP-binding protein LivF n=1 Tax=Meiothermus granaticius NBRC 107808 TaxID=1227551 RepID=A0A399FCX7_9DEIN|nr:ABC transporter ATP-binding protein [Meiothermus granaticius]RIH92581.1 High-affinity branched-chain amino acid transport ATP-binding protein LivF [Meiothermus granaticius NBRC 107808]GEM88072.1 ABC transporter ATP-binding protein [Meiothermus granaticius NBRC 107808]